MAAHPNKHIREAIEYAEARGWEFVKAGGHAHIYGTLYCPRRDREGHRVPIYGTPKSAESHAKWIIRNVNRCQH